MRFRIRHETVYRYSAPVALGPHVTRLVPRLHRHQRVRDHRMAVDPVPRHASTYEDAFGNAVTGHWFDGTTDRLVVVAESEVDTAALDPFDFEIDAGRDVLPMTYDAVLAPVLLPYRMRASVDAAVTGFVADVLAGCDARPMAFALALAQRIQRDFDGYVRESGAAQSAAQTLTAGGGACRDLAVLFMDACRAQNLAARFVSGYRKRTERNAVHDLHAWAEIYVPGGGWRGFDPTEGTMVGEDHVALAAAPQQAGTMPVEGTFTGTAATSALDYAVTIDTA